MFPCMCFHFLFIMGIIDVSLFYEPLKSLGQDEAEKHRTEALVKVSSQAGFAKLFGGPAVMLFAAT